MSTEIKQTRNQIKLLNALHVAREHESIPRQEHDTWTVTLLHFDTGSQNYKELIEDKLCVTWEEGRNVLGRIYSKKHRKRSEIQERPNKSFKEALREKLEGGGSRMSKIYSKINPDKNKKSKSSSPTTSPDIFSSKKHNMDYVTVNGVVLRTGYANKSYWYLLLIKELLDNATDFLWKNYSGSPDASVTVDITTDDSLFHIKVRNTNSRNIPVFQNPSAIFDYDMRYGSKQNQHIISRGMLGDALKQILAWPYVLIHTRDDGSSFKDRQWDKPLIIRCNGIERQIFLRVDKSNERIDVQINQIPGRLSHTDTEIETIWPVIDEVSLDINNIERFCRQYISLTTDIAFKFQLTDNSSTEDILAVDRDGTNRVVDAPALHSISTKWNNISSIHSCKPEEFVSTFTSVYDKDKTTVYDVLRTFKEGTQVAKTPDTEISVAQLLQNPDRDKKLESLYYQLKHILRPQERLSLPYSHLQTEERKRALIDRITSLYPKGYLNTDRAVYRLIHGRYKDDKGILQYPFAFEIIAIPLSDKVLNENTNRPSEFIGAVNYSVAPRSNKFGGEYHWTDKKLVTCKLLIISKVF
jgi:hypothetical protein